MTRALYLTLLLGMNLAMATTSEKTPLPQRIKDSVKRVLSKKPYSMKGVKDLEFIKKEKMLPRGSALITSSGLLAEGGISAIIHAASGSMTKSEGVFEPTPKSVEDSIINSLILARRYRHKRVAIPFIGGGIFASRMGLSKPDLAKLIVETSVKHRRSLTLVFVTFNEAETKLFQEALSSVKSKKASVAQGSITDFNVHKASAIVNAANMEVVFGGGISGAIAKASGKAQEIDQEAHAIIESLAQ